MSSLRFVKLDLGNVPFHIDNVIVHDKEDDELQFDLDIVWKSNCNIQLQAALLGTFVVSELKLQGRLSVILPPILHVLPADLAAQVCFINLPWVDIYFLGLANLADLGLFKDQIRGVINKVISGILVLPNRMYFKIDAANSFLDTYKPPIGVVRLSKLRGSGFDARGGILSDAHDVYFQIRLGDKTIRTSTKENSSDPQWDETFDFLCYDYDLVISFYAWDHDTLGGDDDLGKSQISVRQVLLRGQTAELELHEGTHTGGRIVLCCQLCPFSLSDLASLESSTYSVENESRITGRLTVVIVGVKDIPFPKEDAKPWVKVVYGAIEFKTGTVEDAPAVDCLNPFFDCAFCVRMRPDTDLKAPVELISHEWRRHRPRIHYHYVQRVSGETNHNGESCIWRSGS